MTQLDQVRVTEGLATPPLPTRVFDPPEGGGAAYGSVPGLPETYVEEEYLVSGTANVYDHDADRRLVVKESGRPYTTRILVRRPRDGAACSGTAVLDLLHPEGATATLWPNVGEYLIESGDAYVQVTTSREPWNPILDPPQTAIDRLKTFDPVRYGPIDFVDGGLSWDIISQVGRLLRSDVPENPLRALVPRQLLTGGYSGAGATTIFYINEGFAARDRMPDGSPIFDGYLVGEPSRYPQVNSAVGDEDLLPEDHPFQAVQPRDVPAIQLYTMDYAPGAAFGAPRFLADSDDPSDRCRHWVVPGAYHGGRRAAATGLHILGIQLSDCTYPPSTVPLDHYFVLAVHHLKLWARGESVPPHALPVSFGPDGVPIYDAHGNPVGGVPCVAMEVPKASHPQNGPDRRARMLGGQVEFSPKVLRALYGSREAYLARVDRRIRELIGLGWLLPSQAKDVVDDARKADFGDAPSSMGG